MAAGDRAARNRHPALAHGTVERDFEGAGGDFRVVTVQRHLLLDHGLGKRERIEKIGLIGENQRGRRVKEAFGRLLIRPLSNSILSQFGLCQRRFFPNSASV